MSKTLDAEAQRREDSKHNPSRRGVFAPNVRPWLVGLLRSFVYAFAGIGWMLRSQRNAQVHVLITCIVIIAGCLFRISVGEWLALIMFITLVLALEALNTALEAVVDLASPQIHPLARRAKDAAAGAVLISAIGAVVAGVIVFLPKFLDLIL